MCFVHLADVHSRVAADWLGGCESVWPNDGCYHSFVINLTDRWSVNKINEPVLVHCDTCRTTGYTHSHFSPSLSVLMRFIGITNNVTFALPMQSQLNSRWWGTVQWRKTSFSISGNIFLCVRSFCSDHLKYMQITLYMQIYAKWHQICTRIRYFFLLFIQFLSFICLVLFECLQITLSCARQLGFTFKSSGAQTNIHCYSILQLKLIFSTNTSLGH